MWDVAEVVVFSKKMLAERKDKNNNFADIPEFWKDCIAHDFVRITAQWVEKKGITLSSNADGKLVNVPRMSTWSWGPERKGTDFDGYFQLQHLRIKVTLGGMYNFH